MKRKDRKIIRKRKIDKIKYRMKQRNGKARKINARKKMRKERKMKIDDITTRQPMFA